MALSHRLCDVPTLVLEALMFSSAEPVLCIGSHYFINGLVDGRHGCVNCEFDPRIGRFTFFFPLLILSFSVYIFDVAM